MIVLSTETKKTQDEIMDYAEQYFTQNTGLPVTERNPCCLIFGERYLNYVMVTLEQKDKGFVINIESREYEYWAKKFIEAI